MLFIEASAKTKEGVQIAFEVNKNKKFNKLVFILIKLNLKISFS